MLAACHYIGQSGQQGHETSGTYFELAAFILTQLPDKGSNDDHNRFPDVVARKRTFELTLWTSRDPSGHQNTSAFQRDTFR